MDFTLTEELQAVTDLAEQVMGAHAAPERLAAVEAAGGFDGDLWDALADTGLLGVTLPEEVGGGGQGFLGAHLLFTSAGRHVAHVPLWETLTAALGLARVGGHADLMDAITRGRVVLTVALQEAGTDPEHPATTLEDDGAAVRVTGRKILVPWADRADQILVAARSADGGAPRVVLVPREEVRTRPHALSSDVPHASVELDAARGTLLGDTSTLAWLLDRAVAGLASMQAGMLDAAVRLAADHTSEREQFGRPVATFQAVSQRVASAFVDSECARLCALEAAWRLHEELPASEEVAIAKWWAAEAGHRVLHAAQHVHGGIGVDREYPLHRYYLRTKQVEFTLGSAVEHLGRLGRALAVEPA